MFTSPASAEFIKYNFTITQDLCKQFITVVTGVLVFSLTFSEKIVNFSSARRFLRVLLGISWASMLFAIIACGLGLTYICLAGGQAVYGLDDGYLFTASTAYKWIVAAGVSFIAGLISLIFVSLARPFVTEAKLSKQNEGD
jgi:Mn2+/Fe2+ NRAMP family transporter